MAKISKITNIKLLTEEEEKRLLMSKCTLEERIRILNKLKGGASSESSESRQATSGSGKTKSLSELIKPMTSDNKDLSDSI